MAIFPSIRTAEFIGLKFPVTTVSVKGGVRVAKHEYAFQPGADVESLGRSPLEIQFESIFCDSLFKYGTQLYPLTLGQLQRAFESEERGNLLVPGLGTIKALCTDWTRNMSGKYMNGEAVSMSFIEIVDSNFSTESLVQIQSTSFSDKIISFKEFSGKLPFTPSIFDQIQDLANQVQAILDTPELAFSILSAKISQLTSIIQRADDSLQELQNPENFRISESLRDLWAASESLKNTLLQGSEIQEFTTPSRMSLQEISAAIYGDTSRVGDLLDLNPIQDVLYIPENTKIKYITG